MRVPLVHLPVVQGWDCQATGTCCKEYRIHLTEEECRRIEAQGWNPDSDLGGYQPFRRRGWLRRRYTLNRRPDGSCVFLSAEGRCRIHERHGYETKPLACRLFPFVLIPVADHWRISLRFACPSAAASIGRGLAEHDSALAALAEQLAEREHLPQPNADSRALVRPPRLDAEQAVEWPVLLTLVDHFLALLLDRREPLERRWRKCLALSDLLRKTRLDQLPASSLTETLTLLTSAAAADTPKDPHHVLAPTALGHLLFRLAAALYTRKDHGPNRGLAARGRFALLRAGLRFARGKGTVPRLHRLIPEITFEQAEEPRGPLNPAAETVLERYYLIKVGSLQFCGPPSFGLAFWEGLEALAVTVPVVLWVMRLFRDVDPETAAVQALTIVDDHFGFNPLLASRRMRFAFRLLARRGELARLIAWYSR
jgi:lysine-N-methylase